MINNSEWFSIENLYQVWLNFSKGKKHKIEVMNFESQLEDELWQMHLELKEERYVPGKYSRFVIHDPKKRVIHKAPVRDRVIHRALYEQILPLFHKTWLSCSFSCRPGFGQHLAILKVKQAILKATANYTKDCYVLKCDIQKFFDNIDHQLLYDLVIKKVNDENTKNVLWKIIQSFFVLSPGVGIPIGNLLSQIFANVYLHELDWYVKQELHVKYYYRYADDFVFLLPNQEEVKKVLSLVQSFVETKLKMKLHPHKIIVRKASWGIDWLGVVICHNHELLRKSTEKRMVRRIAELMVSSPEEDKILSVIGSYNGLLKGLARKNIDKKICQTVALFR